MVTLTHTSQCWQGSFCTDHSLPGNAIPKFRNLENRASKWLCSKLSRSDKWESWNCQFSTTLSSLSWLTAKQAGEKEKFFLFSSLCSYGPNPVVWSEPALTPSGGRELSPSHSNLSGSHVAPMCLSRNWSLHHHKHRFLLIEDHKQMTLDSLISGSTLLRSRNKAIKRWKLRLLFC